jgi:hypothetical protein
MLLSPRRPGFAHGSVHVGFVVDKVALGRLLSELFDFPLSISFYRGSDSHTSSQGLAIGPSEAAVQRHRVIPLTRTTTK